MVELNRSEEYSQIAAELIRTVPELQHINDYAVAVDVISANIKKRKGNKLVFADCRKVQSLYKLYCPYDFIITVYEPNASMLDDGQFLILLEHELLHIGVNTDGNEPSFYIVPHDIEDFRSIIEKYGIDWSDKRG